MKSFTFLVLGTLFSVVIANPLVIGPICHIVCPEEEGLTICPSSTGSTCSCCPSPIATLTLSVLPEPTVICEIACVLPSVFCPPCGCCEPSGTVKLPIATRTGIICDIECPLDEESSCCGGPIVATPLAD